MTDEQWVWLFVNQMLDNDEKLAHMCPQCKIDVASNSKCTRCGKPVTRIESSFKNPSFDEDEYNRKAFSTNGT